MLRMCPNSSAHMHVDTKTRHYTHCYYRHYQEFEDARFEQDPEIVNRLIITGRDAMTRTVEAFVAKRAKIIEEEAAALDARQNPYNRR